MPLHSDRGGFSGHAMRDLRVRRFHCPACGLDEDRDVNAAKNILSEALRLKAEQQAAGQTPATSISPPYGVGRRRRLGGVVKRLAKPGNQARRAETPSRLVLGVEGGSRLPDNNGRKTGNPRQKPAATLADASAHVNFGRDISPFASEAIGVLQSWALIARGMIPAAADPATPEDAPPRHAWGWQPSPAGRACEAVTGSNDYHVLDAMYCGALAFVEKHWVSRLPPSSPSTHDGHGLDQGAI